jgi:pyruvate kinase
MISSRQPTRAEVNDVASAVYLKVSAVMLSAETASGHYPIEVTRMMKKIIRRIERQITYSHPELPESDLRGDPTSAIASAAVDLAYRIKAELILVGTASGATAQAISGCRPNVPIVAVTHNEEVVRRLTLLWGVKAILIDKKTNTDDFITQAIDKIISLGFVKKGETLVVASGQQPGIVGGTNMIKVHTL